MKMSFEDKTVSKIEELNRRNALKMMGLGGASILMGTSKNAQAATKLSMPSSHKKSKIVIVGAGTGGIIATARMRRAAPNAQITLIAPNEIHLYQPGQIYVAAGLTMQYDNQRKTADLLPDNVTWLKESVINFDPEKNTLTAKKSGKIIYDLLIVALGAEYDYERIIGLDPSMIGRNGIASVYFNDTIKGKAYGGDFTNMLLKELRKKASKGSVNVLCTEPNTPIKGVGTTLDILFLGNDFLKKESVQKNVHFTFAKADSTLFPSKPFAKALQGYLNLHKNIDIAFEHHLTAIDSQKKIATFAVQNEKVQIPYDFIHIVPPMQAPKVLRDSPLSIQDGRLKGWLAADKHTLQHPKYKNVFGIGDILGIPLGKSGGSAQHQGVILQDNVVAALEDKELPASYDGYTVAPVITEFGKVMPIEFNEKEPLSVWLLNPYESRWIWWARDRYLMRWAYFNLLMRGMM